MKPETVLALQTAGVDTEGALRRFSGIWIYTSVF